MQMETFSVYTHTRTVCDIHVCEYTLSHVHVCMYVCIYVSCAAYSMSIQVRML